MKKYRIGQIVPSSNITMETEIPAIFRSRETILPERFTFHSSRMRMKKVTKEELEAMDKMSLKCAQELSDAHVDVVRGPIRLVRVKAEEVTAFVQHSLAKRRHARRRVTTGALVPRRIHGVDGHPVPGRPIPQRRRDRTTVVPHEDPAIGDSRSRYLRTCLRVWDARLNNERIEPLRKQVQVVRSSESQIAGR